MKKKFKEQRTFPDGVSSTLHGAQFWIAQEQFVASLCFPAIKCTDVSSYTPKPTIM